MLLKITCVLVLFVLGGARGLRRDHEGGLRHGGQDSYGDYEGYREDSSDDFDSARIERFERQPTVKTLSPEELQEVRGAINQILSGYKQDNLFTPLPPIQTSNEKRSITDKKPKQKPRNAEPPHESYIYNAATKFNDYSDIMQDTRSVIQTSELSTDDPSFKPSTHTTDENYDTVLADDFIGATTTSISSWPGTPNTDYVAKFGNNILTTNEIVTENDVTEKSTEVVAYETETNTELTGATLNSLTLTKLPSIEQTNTRDDIKSEIDNILGFSNNLTRITSMTNDLSDLNNNIFDTTAHQLPTRSHLSNILRTENPTEIPQEAETTKVSLEDNVETVTKDENDKKTQPESEVTPSYTTMTTVPQQGPQLTTSHDMTAFHPGTGPESVTEAASVAEEDFHKEEGEANEVGHDKGGGKGQQAQATKPEGNKQPTRSKPAQGGQNQSTPTKKQQSRYTRPNRRSTTTTTKRTTTTKFQLDVPALLAIIANLTYDYEMNLTDNLNATLLKYSIPTCETPTTTQKKGLFIDYEANATGVIVAKCFVCGLEVEKIPRNAHCADAFAGDFLPLVPVDMTARGKISKYRKYCRFADVPHYMVNETQPRSVFGRWSGGCSVRWIDLSGVYTQRSCRSRERAIMGKHFASKRMAKLEMALSNVENGCITSPMATLVPLSRGISLYARFHACVCTGSWCNAAHPSPWITPWGSPALLLLVACISPHSMI